MFCENHKGFYKIIGDLCISYEGFDIFNKDIYNFRRGFYKTTGRFHDTCRGIYDIDKGIKKTSEVKFATSHRMDTFCQSGPGALLTGNEI